jgi:hypothetical protein
LTPGGELLDVFRLARGQSWFCRCAWCAERNPAIIMKIRDMEIKDFFRLLLRFIGLIGLLYLCRHVYYMIHKIGSWHLGWLIHGWATTGQTDMSELRAFISEVLLFAFGWYLVSGCPLFMKLLFPEESEDESAKKNIELRN